MNTSRRRFFGLAAAAPVAAAVPAIAKTPMVEMVAADIAPVRGAFPVMTFVGSDDLVLSVSEWSATHVHTQMMTLARKIDEELFKSLGWRE